MKFLTTLIYFICLWQMATGAEAAEKNKAKAKASSALCSQDEITKFKSEYVKLQNALKYEGKDIELKNGKALAVGEETNSDNSPGLKIEETLYNQYKNALVKVGKIYQKMNKEPSSDDKKLLQNNPDLTKFFKAIDPKNTDRKIIDNINSDALFAKLKSVKVVGFELSDEDTYLLKRLIIHSQDRICTLEKYIEKKSSTKTAYLEQLKKLPLNKMIESLKSLGGAELQLANEETTISEAVKESLLQLRKVIKDNKNCELKLTNSPQLGDVVQTCNYIKFIKSISANQFNEIESILHFINANQHAKNARTGLDWINTQFSQESKTSCYSDPNTKEIYVQNFPLIDGKTIDTAKFSCSKGKTILKAEACAKGLNFNLEDKLGTKISLKNEGDDSITNFSIKGAENCLNVSFNSAPKAEAEIKPEIKSDTKPETPPETKISVTLENACKIDGPCQQNKLTGEMLNLPSTTMFSWDLKTNSCYSVSAIGQPRVDICAELNCKKDPKNIWDAEKKECTVNPQGPSTPVVPPVAAEAAPSSDKEKCEKKDAEWTSPPAVAGAAAEVRTSRYSWDGKECKDKKAAQSGPQEETEPESKPEVVYPNKPVPGRFQPITIPTRQIYILPGMP